VEAVPLQGVVPPVEQLAVTWIVWQTLSKALNSSVSPAVPLALATRAPCAPPPLAKLDRDWPSIVQVKPQPA
jgi:hypothetical protein